VSRKGAKRQSWARTFAACASLRENDFDNNQIALGWSSVTED